ncbi:unnamed protein product [Camellia sinensis]
MAGGGLVRFSVLRSSQLLISCLRDLRLQSSFLEGKMPAWAVKLWLADKTVLPIENSLGGSIHRNYDLLLWHKLHIVGEVQLAVNLCLLALPGVRTEHLKRVLSHPQMSATVHQSGVLKFVLPWRSKCLRSFPSFFNFVMITRLPGNNCFRYHLSKLGATREKVNDTASAAQMIYSCAFGIFFNLFYTIGKLPVLIVLTLGQLVASNELRDAGAVASARAAEIYGLDILAERIQCGRYSCSKKYHFSPSHTGMLATGSYGQTTAIYREDNMELLYILHGQQGGVRDMCNSQKMVTIYIQGGNRSFGLMLTLGLYRSSENTNQRILFDIDPFGQHLGTGSEDGLVHIYNLQMGQWVSSFQAALALHQGRFVSFDDSLEDFSLSDVMKIVLPFGVSLMLQWRTMLPAWILEIQTFARILVLFASYKKDLDPLLAATPTTPSASHWLKFFFIFFLLPHSPTPTCVGVVGLGI